MSTGPQQLLMAGAFVPVLRVYTTVSSNVTETATGGAAFVAIECWGSGAPGGSGVGVGCAQRQGGGGGAGGYSRSTTNIVSQVTPTFTWTIGNLTFLSKVVPGSVTGFTTITCNGGTTGQAASGAINGNGGAGGTATNANAGAVNTTGGAGQNGDASGASGQGGTAVAGNIPGDGGSHGFGGHAGFGNSNSGQSSGTTGAIVFSYS